MQWDCKQNNVRDWERRERRERERERERERVYYRHPIIGFNTINPYLIPFLILDDLAATTQGTQGQTDLRCLEGEGVKGHIENWPVSHLRQLHVGSTVANDLMVGKGGRGRGDGLILYWLKRKRIEWLIDGWCEESLSLSLSLSLFLSLSGKPSMSWKKWKYQ